MGSGGLDRMAELLRGFLKRSLDRYVGTLSELVAVPSVSALGEHMDEAAGLVADLLSERGFRTEVRRAGGHPVVFGELRGEGKTILLYNHYDVQPPDPIRAWRHPPFELVAEGGLLFGRGTADNKGNIVARLAAIDALTEVLGELPLTVKFLVEGEEEIGSPNLPRFVEEHRGDLGADGGIWETGYVGRGGELRIYLGFKGMLYVELVVKGPSRDVHSGYAPIVPNPIWRLVRLACLLKGPDGRVLIPGFYEGLAGLGYDAEDLLSRIPFDEEALKEELGLEEFVGGLTGLEALRHLHLMPSLNISGIYGGYTGEGGKTVIPSRAGMKLDIRLVPGQDPEAILGALKGYLAEEGFGDVEVIVHSNYPAGFTRPDEEVVQASARAAELAYGVGPALIPMSAGSGPMYLFTDVLGIPMTGAGVGYYGSRVHAPDENIREDDFLKGMVHVALTLLLFSGRWGKG
ncbi:hypothetical protein DRO32_02305 [Candidatus Bathyarchaeota archaeon]|nr:MAG: hypothetical protein DRO32_02305 [Candidatus Bathyarchaeota archaeon]